MGTESGWAHPGGHARADAMGREDAEPAFLRQQHARLARQHFSPHWGDGGAIEEKAPTCGSTRKSAISTEPIALRQRFMEP